MKKNIVTISLAFEIDGWIVEAKFYFIDVDISFNAYWDNLEFMKIKMFHLSCINALNS